MFASHDFDLKMTFDVKSLVKGKTQQTNQPQEKTPLNCSTQLLERISEWDQNLLHQNPRESVPWVLTLVEEPVFTAS